MGGKGAKQRRKAKRAAERAAQEAAAAEVQVEQRVPPPVPPKPAHLSASGANKPLPAVPVKKKKQKYSKYTLQQKAARRVAKLEGFRTDEERAQYLDALSEQERAAVGHAVRVKKVLSESVFLKGKPKRKVAKAASKKKPAAAPKKKRGLRTDYGRNEERMLEGRLHMLNKNGKISRGVLRRIGTTDPTHWSSGTAARNWKRYDKNSNVPWTKTSRMNTDISYRHAKWPPGKFLREDYKVVPWVKLVQAGNPYMRDKKIITVIRKGKEVKKAVHKDYKQRAKK